MKAFIGAGMLWLATAIILIGIKLAFNLEYQVTLTSISGLWVAIVMVTMIILALVHVIKEKT